MEAATPLRHPHVRTVGDRLVLDGVVIDDECAVRLVREREEAGEDPVRLVADAVEIGARVLEREQAGANAEFVRTELERVVGQVEASLADRTGAVSEQLTRKLDEAFGVDSGHVTKAIERHFSDDSSAAVQNRVREVVRDAMTNVQQALVRQFSSADAQNPLAEFKAGVVRSVHQAAQQQGDTLRAIDARMATLQEEVASLRAERDKLAELEAERERGTAKGRTFEEEVAEAIDAIAAAQGDDCEAVGDTKGATGRTGDVVVAIDACRGPARGRIVFEAKTGQLSRPKAMAELDRGMHERDADFAVLVVPGDDKLPARTRALREYNGDKLLVVHDPDAGDALTLEVAYSLARARVLMKRADGDGVDAAALRDTVERAIGAMDDVRRVKSQLTGAKTQIDKGSEILDLMAEKVREHLRAIEDIAASAGAEAAAQASLDSP